ncbi:protein GLE1-like isoform X2 [Chenopodium quinoa]|uniref:protein GLE1-like isoform X2 n=1 Tax=Chenopodium quinoa TaxID=63459 RepID=UPI000B792DE9|nr:protein GLE1-like isoform X2 [Chenopodium quinoa]
MGMINLELRCPKNVDPNPSWNFDNLMSELSSLESKLYKNGTDSSLNPKPFIKSPARDFRKIGRREKSVENSKAFVMRIDDVELDEFDDDEGTEAGSLVPSSRFTFTDIYLSESDDSDDEQMQQMQVSVMDKMGVVEGAFLEVTHEHQLGVKEEIRNQLAVLETQLVAEKEKSTSALVQVEKNIDVRRQMDRKLDLHYQRKIAEALDDHLTAIQRDHEHRSQLEERKIRDDAAVEEAKRKEKALQEEKLRQQKAKEDQEARLEAAKRAEEERKAAQEAEKLAKEAADKMKEENLRKDYVNAQKAASITSAANVSKEMKSSGNLVRAAVNALKLEERRLQIYKELNDRNQLIISGSHTNFVPKERDIKRTIRQITGTIDNVRSKASKLVEILKDPACPQSVSMAMFAKEITSIFETTSPKFNSSAFACGHVIVYVSSQVPAVMDCLLAEFHKACIYTVPKHIMYSKAAFETEESYYKAIGYREENGKIETTDSYLERIESLMKLYGALVQTVAQGVQNKHGLEEGWVWLARFLNVLPPNRYTAVALEAFLEMAGFALHGKYKSQFVKVLNTISREFVPKLRARDPNAGSKISRIQEYIESQKFLQEPTGWRLQGALLSHTFVPEADRRQEQYHHAPSRHFTYHR